MPATQQPQACPKCGKDASWVSGAGTRYCHPCGFHCPNADWNALCYVREEQPRRMQGNLGHSPGSYHSREHNENENCLPDGCRPVEPTPAAPDPGEGWRMIDVEKEDIQPTDQKWTGSEWSTDWMHISYENAYFRRRIEKPAAPEWEDVPILHDHRGRYYPIELQFRSHANAVSEPGFMGYVYDDVEIKGVSMEPVMVRYLKHNEQEVVFPVAWRKRKGGA